MMTDPISVPPADLQAELARWKDIAARAQADLQNAKERLKRDREEMGLFAAEKLLLSLLPTLDGFQRAMKHLPADLKNNEWVKGIAATEADLLNRLKDIGLKRFDSVGAKADPRTEEVVMTGPGEAGVVTEMLEDGYALHEKVLRPAKVRVGNGENPA